MKILAQTVLVFTEGKSEKVYEIDLCEVGADQCVVNFRYGTRGATLKDGSKTPLPVKRAEAQKVFDKLAQTKIEQGYVPEDRANEARARAEAARAEAATRASSGGPYRGVSPASSDRERVILDRLAQTGADRRFHRREGSERGWGLERAIWRAGELRLRAAEPLLLNLLGSAQTTAPVSGGGKGMRDYAVAWALAQLGSEASVEPLARLAADPNALRHVRKIATEALRNLSTPEVLAAYRRDVTEGLPEPLRAAITKGDAAAFEAALTAHLAEAPESFAVMELLYLVDSALTRPAFLKVLRTTQLAPPFFYSLRYLFKAAELRRDAEVFGILAYRFEKVRANTPYSSIYDDRVIPGRTAVNPFTRERIELPARTIRGRARPEGTLPRNVPKAYCAATREYLRRRTWRTLRRMGQLGDPDYVKMAVGVLLPFTDADRQTPRRGYQASWDAYAPYRAFNGVLYTHSPRYELKPGTRAYRTKGRYKPGDLAPDAREEAFPKLWERAPAGLMHLLSESECTVVHEFGAKALRACSAFTADLDDDDLAMLAARPYHPTAQLAFDLTKLRVAAGRPASPRLLLALASSIHGPARELAVQWIEMRRAELLQDTVFLAALVTAPLAEARQFARRFLRSASFSPEAGAVLVGRIVATLLLLGEQGAGIALDATQTLTSALGTFLASAPPAVIRDLLAHPLEGVQELGAELLLKHDSRSGLLPVEIILTVFRSPFASVRSVGLRLLSEMADDALALNFKVLVVLSADKNADLRHGVRPLLGRLCRVHRDIGMHLVKGLVDALLRRKLADDVAPHLVAILRDDLRDLTQELDHDTVWRLLQSASPHAQELGGLLLQHFDADDMELEQLVRLASHEILSVREASWAMLGRSIPRIHADMANAVRVADAKWKDSRDWAFGFFRTFAPELFTLEVLVSIADSTQDDVQAFGREMLQRGFREEDGPELLLRLSEHPQRSVQLFTTNYLERFAAGDTTRLRKLVPYFTSVLSRVNAGRLAKTRVFAFLEREAARSEEHAAAVVDLLHRVSGSISVESRARAVEIMCAIHRAVPSVALPLAFVPPEPRAAAAPRAGGA